MLNFATICRVCMQSDEELDQIFDEKRSDEGIGIATMMSECSKYKVLRHDGLPQRICRNCLTALRSAYRWKENCEMSHRHLLKILANSKRHKDAEEEEHKEHTNEIQCKDELRPDDMTAAKSENVINVIEPMHTVLIKETCEIHNIKEDCDEDAIDERISSEDPISYPSCDESDLSLRACNSSFTAIQRKKPNNVAKTKCDEKIKRPTCSECAEHFQTRAELHAHRKSASHCRIWLCPQCGLRCTSSSNLKDHMRRHNGDKPHKCKFCSKSFTRMVDVRIHEKFHTGEKSHFCEICGRGFQLKYSLTTHRRLHTGEKPYKCPHCPQAFSRGGDLKLHSRHHTGERLRCDCCDASYLEARKLRKHKLAKHGIEVETLRRRVAKYTSPKQQEQQIQQLQQATPPTRP